MTTSPVDGSAAPTPGIIFYWRPGCGFCSRLKWSLDRKDIPLDQRNIWDSPEAAAAVRAVANGNETVPTVVVGPVAMVNPSPGEVIDAMRQHTPELLPAKLR